jgi:hypothetical protein
VANNFQTLGRRWWFSFPLCSHAGQIVQEFESSGFIEGIAQFAEGHGDYDVIYVGRCTN